MFVSPPTLLPELAATVRGLTATFGGIPHGRLNVLRQLSNYLREHRQGTIRLHFICSHNSRRSQLAMVWAGVAAVRYGYPDVQVSSGGTETTAFFPAAVAALERQGFRVAHAAGENPIYGVTFSTEASPLDCYSKRYDAPGTPTQDFAAVLTCAEVDALCPIIPGADCRIALPYDDPKVADGKPNRQQHYDERAAEIGRELLFAFAAGASPFLRWPELSGQRSSSW